MSNSGITTTIECGPGKVLSGLNKRINSELTTLSVEKSEDVDSVLAQF
jgi:[acyl-carrier-protein] S-malonyltransferase